LNTILDELKNTWIKKLVMYSRQDAWSNHWEMNIPTEIYYGVKNDTTVLKTKQFKHG